ncbi:MAG: hypothetical protein NVS3B18_06920 [Candidatus Dormibacteria bacterium]
MMRAMLRHPVQFTREHRLTRAQAPAFLDGELAAGECAQIEHHAQLCPPCARLMTSLRQTISALHSLGRVDPDPTSEVTEAILRRLREDA